jgi:crotonyl-CoA reductase
MQAYLDAIQGGASGADIAALPVPESYRAATVHKDEAGMFEGVDSSDKDPRKSIHVEEVATPSSRPTRSTSP